MHARDLEHYRNVILGKRRQLLQNEKTLDLIVEEDIASCADIGNSKFPATHLAEVGSETMLREQNSYFQMRREKFLLHLDEALLRLEKGGFGTCCQCGKEIPQVRLEAVPHTRYGVTCKRKWEHGI